MGDADAGSPSARTRQADHGLRPPRVPRRGSALARPQGDREELGSPRFEVAEALEKAALDGLHRAQARPRARDERRVLLGRRPRLRRDPAAAHARDVRVRTGGRLVGAHPRAEAHRPAVPARPPSTSARTPPARPTSRSTPGRELNLAEAVAAAPALGDERALADLRREVDEELEAAIRSDDFRSAPSPTARSARSTSPRRPSSCGAASRTTARPAAARRSSHWSCSRATTPASSTPAGRCCTSS